MFYLDTHLKQTRAQLLLEPGRRPVLCDVRPVDLVQAGQSVGPRLPEQARVLLQEAPPGARAASVVLELNLLAVAQKVHDPDVEDGDPASASLSNELELLEDTMLLEDVARLADVRQEGLGNRADDGIAWLLAVGDTVALKAVFPDFAERARAVLHLPKACVSCNALTHNNAMH